MKYKIREVKIPVEDQFMDGSLYFPDTTEKPILSVVIFHGRGSQKSRYTDRAEALAQNGFITLIFSFRGCGESDGDFSDQTPAMGLQDGIAAYDFLAKQNNVDTNRIGVWGGSFGGYIAALLTNERPVHSLILAAPALYRNDWWDTVLEKLSEGESQNYRNGTNFSDNRAIVAIQKYTGPILLIRHEFDEVCPKAQTQSYLQNAKSSTMTKEVVISNLGHRLEKPEHRKESNDATVEWFKNTL